MGLTDFNEERVKTGKKKQKDDQACHKIKNK